MGLFGIEESWRPVTDKHQTALVVPSLISNKPKKKWIDQQTKADFLQYPLSVQGNIDELEFKRI